MRICTLVDRFPPLVGGVEIQAKQLSAALVQRGVTVTVITRQARIDLPPQESSEGLKIYRVPPAGERGHLLNILAVFHFIRALLRHRREYDVIHVHDMFSLLLAAIFVCMLLRKPLVVKVPTHGNIIRLASQTTRVSLYSRILHNVILPRPLWFWLLRRASAFIAISDEIAAELEKAGLGHKTVRIPNAVDVSRFRPAEPEEKQALRARLGLPQDAVLLVSHGRIVERKRIDVLLRAVAQVRPECDVHVVLPGTFPADVPLGKQLTELIVSLELQEYIVLPGATQQPEDYLRAADVFVLASEREGMPNALLEAMACGLVCVASEIGGVTDLVTHGYNGYLFPVGDSGSLVDLLREILPTDDTLKSQTGSHALKMIQSQYTWNVIAPRYVELYRKLLKGPRAEL